MSDDLFIREIDEELRQEQAKKLWQRFGGWIIGGAVLIVVLVAGYRGWIFYSEKQAAESGARYEAALQMAREGKEADALKEFDAIANDSPGKYGTLAKLSSAAYKAKIGDNKGAVAIYDALVSSSADPAFKDLAQIRAALLLVDTASRDDIIRRVGAIDAADNPWRHSAREILGLAAFKANKHDDALAVFQKMLADRATPQDARQRVQIMMALLTPGQNAAGATNGQGQAEATESAK